MRGCLSIACVLTDALAIGTVLVLHLPWMMSALLVGTPVFLLVLVLRLPKQQPVVQEQDRFNVYVAVDQRNYPRDVMQVYQPVEQPQYEQMEGRYDDGMSRWN